MCSARDNVALPTLGFPIRASAGHWPFSASPRLIAAVHALHRLLVPRHPPCALTILTVILETPDGVSVGRALRLCPVIPVSLATVQFSRSAKRRSPPRMRPGTVVQRAAGSEPVSQNSTACVQSADADSIGRNLLDRVGVATCRFGQISSGRNRRQAITQVRSTCLVADRARGERRGATARHGCFARARDDDPPAIGALH